MDRDYKPLSSKFHRIRNSLRSVVRRGSKHKSNTSTGDALSLKTAGSLSSTGSTSNAGKKSKSLLLFGGKNSHV